MKKIIDHKNPNTVGTSIMNLGNHILMVMFALGIIFVVYNSY